jgi:hypothetical protein
MQIKHDLMPFGKFKDKPLAYVACDKAYTKWVIKQLLWRFYPEEKSRLIELANKETTPIEDDFDLSSLQKEIRNISEQMHDLENRLAQVSERVRLNLGGE